MNAIKNFLNFVEISTKIASTLPFLVGTGYAAYRFGSFKPKQALVFFVAMLLFDMTTTAINNHIGHRQTGRKSHYSSAVSLAIIFGMGIAAAVLGIYLVIISSIAVLLVGILCFAMGVLYSYGFIPISRTPFGELCSGVIMGFCIPFIAVEISHPMIFITLHDVSRITIEADLLEFLALGIVVMPLICCIANIMLANNVCDVEEDARIKRYTLPFYIGIKKSILLYKIIYIVAYLFIIIGSVTKIIPLFTLVMIITYIPVRKNILKFMELQDKQKTFFTVILNFLIITVPYAACIWLGNFLPIIGMIVIQ
jgi:1,4-dihydroxy-2-naphthoate octaprenyltransferase